MLLIDVPAGSKLHSPLLDLIFIGSPGVLHPDVGTFQLNGKGVCTGRMATMPACFDCRLLKCYFGSCVMMLECDSV